MPQYESELSPISRDSYFGDPIVSTRKGELEADNAGVRLDVRNVSYSVMVKRKEKKLLRNVNVRLVPGEMCALMGPSGAGKR